MPPTRSEFAHDLGLDPSHPLVVAARPALRLTPDNTGPSRLGGLPAMAPDAPWPRWDATSYLRRRRLDAAAKLERSTSQRQRDFLASQVDHYATLAPSRPLTLVAQLDCADLVGSELALPRDGWLCFFYDVDEQPWGYHPEHQGAWRVVYVPPGPPGPPRLPPHDLPGVLPVQRVRAVPVWTLPPPPLDGRYRTSEEAPDVRAARERLDAVDPPPRHQVGGLADAMRDDAPTRCALVAAGVDLSDDPELDPKLLADAQADASAWRLLLQLGSDDDLAWGLGGTLGFWIHENDLADGAFDRVWVDLQWY